MYYTRDNILKYDGRQSTCNIIVNGSMLYLPVLYNNIIYRAYDNRIWVCSVIDINLSQSSLQWLCIGEGRGRGE